MTRVVHESLGDVSLEITRSDLTLGPFGFNYDRVHVAFKAQCECLRQ